MRLNTGSSSFDTSLRIGAWTRSGPDTFAGLCALTTTESRAKIWHDQMHLSPTVTKAAVRSELLVPLLLFYCLLLLPLFVGVLCLVLVFLFSTLCPSSFAIYC